MDRVSRTMKVQLQRGQRQECCYDPFGDQRFASRTTWTPNTDIVETERSVVILMELAGMDREAVQVVCEGDLLRISGVRTRRKIQEAKRFHRMEIDYGPFEKLFRIPADLEVDEIKAEYQNGFLEVTLPKKKEEEARRLVVIYEEG
ncbi:MAG: Hsp20/alpha crystallin family protein [bacterium]